MKIFTRILLIIYSFYSVYFLNSCSSSPSDSTTNKTDSTYSVSNNKIIVDTTNIYNYEDTTISVDNSSLEICKTKKIIWTPGSSESILLDPQNQVIFPGNVLSAKSFQDGTFKQIGVEGDRKPITISISIPNFKHSYAKINIPTLHNVQDGINGILRDSMTGVQPAKVSVNSYEVYSKDHLSLLMRGKYSGGTSKVEAGFNFDDTNIKSRYLLDITHIYYEINVDEPGPSGFFKKKPEGIEEKSPVYISSIKYGRRILVAVESTDQLKNSAANFQAEFNYLVGNASVGSSALSEQMLKNRSIKLLVMGGNSTNAFSIFRAISSKDSLFSILHKDAIMSLSNVGVPLAYTVKHCYDGEVFTVSQSGEYVARMCESKAKQEKLIYPSDVLHLCARADGGDDREFAGNPWVTFNIDLFSEGNNIYANIRASWKEDDGDTSGSRTSNRFLIASVPDSLEVLAILSQKQAFVPNQRTGGYGATKFADFTPETSPIEFVSMIGDTSGSDDMFPGCTDGADDEHAQIRQIKFFPIKVSYTSRVVPMDKKIKKKLKP